MRPSSRLMRSLPPTIRSILADGPLDSAQTVHGWVRSIRAHKNVAFAEVDDGTGRVQAVLKGKGKADGLTQGSSVALSGTLEASRGKGQEVEFMVDTAETVGSCDPDVRLCCIPWPAADVKVYPIQKKHLPPAFLRDHAHLRFRTARTAAIMRVRDSLMRYWHDWFESNEFVHIHTPILTSSDCEGAGETFTLVNPAILHPSAPSSTSAQTPIERFFPHPVNLTVSSQLHLEAPTHALSRTYTLSPAFRAEPSLTSRHLSEFYMLEAEIAFVETLDQLLEVVERGIREVLHRLMWEGGRGERTRKDLEIIRDHESDESDTSVTMAEPDRPPLSHLINASARPFARMTYTSAIAFLKRVQDDGEAVFEHPPIWGQGLSSEHERFLATHHGGPLFITHYPATIKPFYMLPSSADPSWAAEGGEQGETVACFDLVLPGLGELIGGSMREHRLGPLVSAMRKAGLKEEEYEWYLDLRRFGSVSHGGWGMGWERWVCWVTGVGNIRDVVAFPRWKGNCRY